MESSSFVATHVPLSIEGPGSILRACCPASYPHDSSPLLNSHVNSKCATELGRDLYTHFQMMLMGLPTCLAWGPKDEVRNTRHIQLVPYQLDSGQHLYLSVEEAKPFMGLVNGLTAISPNLVLDAAVARREHLLHADSTLNHLPPAFKPPLPAWMTKLTGIEGQLADCRAMMGLKPNAPLWELNAMHNPEKRLPGAMLGPKKD